MTSKSYTIFKNNRLTTGFLETEKVLRKEISISFGSDTTITSVKVSAAVSVEATRCSVKLGMNDEELFDFGFEIFDATIKQQDKDISPDLLNKGVNSFYLSFNIWTPSFLSYWGEATLILTIVYEGKDPTDASPAFFGIDTNTALLIGGVAVGGFVLLKRNDKK